MDEGGFFPEQSGAANDKVDSVDAEDTSLLIPLEKSECCMYCGRVPVCSEIKKTFMLSVCSSCSRTEIKLITKTQCKSTYLLTEEELRQFRHLARPNPHKGTWNEMQLYLESEVAGFSMEKFGSAEMLEKTKRDRKEQTKRTKIDQIRRRVKELKRHTFLRPSKERHRHAFIGGKCECGMVIDEEEI